MSPERAHIPIIIDQHVEDASFLWLLRDAAIAAPHYTLKDLAALDNRVEAHLDGLRIAGEAGWAGCLAALERNEPGEVFAASVLAFESNDGKRIDPVMDAGFATPENFRALVSALGWIDYRRIEPLICNLLNANSPDYRRVGIAATAVHRQDPCPALQKAIETGEPLLVVPAIKAAGEIDRQDLLPLVRAYLKSEDEACRFWSTWAAVMLGEHAEVYGLMPYVDEATVYRDAALQLALRVLDAESARNWLGALAKDPAQARTVLTGAGVTGDPVYVPMLIKHMLVPELARLAGEAFSMISGVDLAYQDMEGEWPDDFEAGPSENPEDEDVDLDADEDLPWPDPALVQQWWDANQRRFQPGACYLTGQAATPECCSSVLLNGFQRQRTAAALELALVQADTALFETRAPGFRQQRLLGQHW